MAVNLKESYFTEKKQYYPILTKIKFCMQK